ncbi:MAG: ParB/RepB/Spo0J family partition protein [Nitrososphaerales archaeon]
MQDLPLDSVEENPFNSRNVYSASSIERMMDSLGKNGQLLPVSVRPSAKHEGKFELVSGHRRMKAAKRLGWNTIRVEVVKATDEQMIIQSLVENLEREDIRDYDKALAFERMNNEFGMTYVQIGRVIGISKQHVSNYIGMLRVFDARILAENPELLGCMKEMTEHHARVIAGVREVESRIDLARMVAREKLTVKDLSSMVSRLRSWFTVREASDETLIQEVRNFETSDRQHDGKEIEQDVEKVAQVVLDEFRLAEKGDFDSYSRMHLFEDGFSIYSAFPPFRRFEENAALRKERYWFYEIAPKLSWKVRDLKIKILGEMALATLSVSYSGTYLRRQLEMDLRGTVVLVSRLQSWKILHEHWSALDIRKIGPIRRNARPAVHSSKIEVAQ